MSKLISGKEALIALANGKDVQYKFPDGIWMDFTTNLNLRGSGLKVVDFLNDYAEFRLKPRTVNLSGVEVGQLYSTQWDKRNPKEVIIEFKTEEEARHFNNNALNIFNGV